ncbi:hypothetical protein H0I76_09355 [Limibaculum sp. M0105]|uniref:Outer membrane protein assembly factor BamE n=1 Tax=Thermohalobaculum xanthum TaxID=2753746 RepID=A0A8J7M6X9_9RHOB|nr:hypothetical protein [Thermohalobaculum xanthum]MBK0399396.1 hypothetical protein [Thermohalobaculum xanthum]
MTAPTRTRMARAGLAGLAAAVLGTAPTPSAADEFPEVGRIETSLSRGVSTQREVQALLGVPDGIGNSVFPPDYRRHDVWFYEDIELLGMTTEGEITKVGVRQQILLVFFHDGRFDGFAWSSSTLPGDVK